MLTFDLNNANDLRDKLRRDLAKLKATPLNTDCAFNFFVTAEHMLDWIYPKRAGKAAREGAKASELLLQSCSHLANGMKHFEVEAKHHESVAGTDTTSGYFNSIYFGTSHWGESYFGGGPKLIVRLKNRAAQALGPVISVIELADKVMDYWDKHPLK